MNASALFLPGAGRINSRLALSALLALTLMLLPALRPSVAHASDPLDFSAGDQYVETLPTAKGPKVTENAPKHRKGAGLSEGVQRKLQAQGGSDVATLQSVAESPQLGAPQSSGSSDGDSGSASDGSQKGKGNAVRKGTPSVPSAAINAAGGSGSGLGWLVVSLPLITALALGAFGIQRRSHQDADQ
jgi:hypothetical protein